MSLELLLLLIFFVVVPLIQQYLQSRQQEPVPRKPAPSRGQAPPKDPAQDPASSPAPVVVPRTAVPRTVAPAGGTRRPAAARRPQEPSPAVRELRSPLDLRRAVVLMTILAPGRGLRPYNGPMED